MQVPIGEIRIKDGRRRPGIGHVQELADSIRELGLLNPVTIDRRNFLIAGFHRLEAAKMLGWTEIECSVSSLGGLRAELAEIDENIVRSGIPALEYGEILLRRKEIYETLHPETRRGGDRKSDAVKAAKCRFENAKSFVQDTADKLGVVPRTVERQIQTAKNLVPEAKEIIRDTETKLSKKAAMKLSRLEPERQREAAELLAARKIRTVDEYVEGLGGGREPQPGQCGVSLEEIVAQLKDPDRDCSGTPDSFLAEYAAFVQKFHREIGWYEDPYYDAVYPLLDGGQLAGLRKMTDSICAAAERLFHKAERMRKT